MSKSAYAGSQARLPHSMSSAQACTGLVVVAAASAAPPSAPQHNATRHLPARHSTQSRHAPALSFFGMSLPLPLPPPAPAFMCPPPTVAASDLTPSRGLGVKEPAPMMHMPAR